MAVLGNLIVETPKGKMEYLLNLQLKDHVIDGIVEEILKYYPDCPFDIVEIC